MGRKKKSEEPLEYLNERKFSTPMSEEARENQMIELAMDLVEWRLRHGVATSQETTHFLKLGCIKAKHDQEMQDTQMELIKAKTSAIKESKSMAELYSKAMESMRIYRGEADDSEYET
jgi:hypothetical protein